MQHFPVHPNGKDTGNLPANTGSNPVPGALMKQIPNYPIKNDYQVIHARHPVQITQDAINHYIQRFKSEPLAIQFNSECDTDIVPLAAGNYMAVEINHTGYIYPMAPVQFVSRELCQKACDKHNERWWTREQVNQIINHSITLNHEQTTK